MYDDGSTIETLKKVTKIWWCAFCTFTLGISIFDGTVYKNLATFSHITFWMVLQNLLVGVVVMTLCIGLFRCHPIFKWSWFCLFNREQVDYKNINLIPLEIKYFGLVYGLLLLINLPSLAMMEETMFRAGTQDWLKGILMSLWFGMAHCVVGVPIGAGVAITIAGLWYTKQYFAGGIQLSALHHTTFNLIFLSLILIELIIKHVVKPNSKVQKT